MTHKGKRNLFLSSLVAAFLASSFGAFDRPMNYEEAAEQHQLTMASLNEFQLPATVELANGNEIEIWQNQSSVKKFTGRIGWTDYLKSWCYEFDYSSSATGKSGKSTICYPLRKNMFTGSESGDSYNDWFWSPPSGYQIQWK